MIQYVFQHPIISIISGLALGVISLIGLGAYLGRTLQRPLDPDQDERAMSAQAISEAIKRGHDFTGKD